MNATMVSWALVLFFGTSLVFGGLRRLTEDSSTAVTILVQVAALAAIIGAVVLFVRIRERRR